jgi:hypothetical protein
MLAYLKRHHLALLALFIALGGTSYAATQLPSNSVGTNQIRAGAVTSNKIQNGAITSAKLSHTLRTQLARGGTGAGAEAPWRDPSITTSIGSAGQTVVSQTTVTVPANAPWVSSGLSLTPGEHLWTDTRTDGRWSGNPSLFPYSDAEGLSTYPGQYRVDAKAAVESLIGFVGSSPPTPPEVSVRVGSAPGGTGGITDPGYVEVGNTLLNFTPVTAGTIWFRNNDNTNYVSDVGRQFVKVLVTR